MITKKSTQKELDINLLNSVLANNLESIQKYIKQGANVYYDDKDIVMASVARGHLEALKLLHTAGADLMGVNTSQEYPLEIAVRNGNFEIVDFLVSIGVDIYYNDNICVACAGLSGNLEIIKLFHSKGVDFTLSDDVAFRKVVMGGHLDALKYMLEITDVKDTDKLYSKIMKASGIYSRTNIAIYMNQNYGANIDLAIEMSRNKTLGLLQDYKKRLEEVKLISEDIGGFSSKNNIKNSPKL